MLLCRIDACREWVERITSLVLYAFARTNEMKHGIRRVSSANDRAYIGGRFGSEFEFAGINWQYWMEESTSDQPHRGWHPPTGYDDESEKSIWMYNSLTDRKEKFVPKAGLHSKKIVWYSCGPTVYDSAHMGHSRWAISKILEHIWEFSAQPGVVDLQNVDKYCSQSSTLQYTTHLHYWRICNGSKAFWALLDVLYFLYRDYARRVGMLAALIGAQSRSKRAWNKIELLSYLKSHITSPTIFWLYSGIFLEALNDDGYGLSWCAPSNHAPHFYESGRFDKHLTDFQTCLVNLLINHLVAWESSSWESCRWQLKCSGLEKAVHL